MTTPSRAPTPHGPTETVPDPVEDAAAESPESTISRLRHKAAALVPTAPEPEPEETTPPSLVDRVKAVLEWWKRTRVARALTRYSQANGALLCGGIAYSAIFSIVAALSIGFTVFMAVLGSNAELRASLVTSIDSMLPGLLKTSASDKHGMIDPDTLVMSSAFSVVSVVSVVVLLVSAISCMGAIRASVRVMFGLPPGGGNAVHAKLRELGGFVIVGLAVLLSAVVGIGVNTVSTWLLSTFGIEGASRVFLPVAGFVVSFLIDMGVFSLVVIVLAGIRPPWPDLLLGAGLAALGFGVIRFLGTSVVAGGASKNALLASFAVIVTLLIWINLSARIMLTAAAITADIPLEILEQVADEEAAREAIEAAREGRQQEADLSARIDEAAERDARTVKRRLLVLCLAVLGGYTAGRRSRAGLPPVDSATR